jgi:hypothetical protein
VPLDSRIWEGGGEGSPESEDLSLAAHPEPLAEGGFVFRRSLVSLAVVVAALSLAGLATAAVVHIRVEGKTQTIFGATEPRVSATNALDALMNTARAAEFFAHVAQTSFGPYIDQIGYYPAGGSDGWVFKVNGVSPPVGADQVQLKDGDDVLWYFATFGATGGPPTLTLSSPSVGCYRATGQDDAGKEQVPPGLVFHIGTKVVPAPAGHVCPKRPHGLVWASAPTAVRSNRLP